MEQAAKQLRIICYFMAATILMYAGMAWRLPSSAKLQPIMFQVLTLLAVSLVVAIFGARKIMVQPAQAILTSQPADEKQLKRWRAGHVLTYCFCEAIALYGFLLHFLGGSMMQVAPFFIAGLVLMLFSAPRAAQAEFPRDSQP